MALNFVATSSDLVDHGSASNLDNLSTLTCCAWVYTTDTSAARRILQKSTGSNRIFMLFDATNFAIERTKSVSSANAFAAKGNFTHYDLNKWMFCAGSLDDGSAANCRALIGDLTHLAAEPTSYGGQSAGSGTYNDAADVLWVGGNGVLGISGRVAWVGLWNRVLSVAEIQQQQYRQFPTSGCVLFTHYGLKGTGTQPDWSGTGNTGAVTGATVADHVPIGPLFGFDDDEAYIVPAAATAFPEHYYRQQFAA